MSDKPMPPIRAHSIFSKEYMRPKQVTSFTERVGLRGHVTITHRRAGEVLAVDDGDNLITNAGFAGFAGLIAGTGHTDPFEFIGIGEGTTAAAVTDTALEDEITTFGGARAAATMSRVTVNVTNDTLRALKTFTFTAGASFAVTEAGLLSLVTAGVLCAHRIFSAFNVVPSDTLEVDWRITQE